MPQRRAGFTRSAMAGALLGVALAAAAAPPAGTGVLPPPSPSAGFAQARTPRIFEFPRDHGPHPEFRQEWWYLTGNLDAADGGRFGFELTFFRFALAPPAAPAQVGPVGGPAGEKAGAPAGQHSAWRSREIFMAHFAVTDVGRRRFRFAEKLSREALGLAGARGQPLAVWIDDWTLTKPAVAGPASRWTLHAAQEGYSIDLALEPLMTPVLNGDAGLSRKSAEPDDASYYYSIPRLRLRGRLVREGESFEVGGLAWLDREWGSGGLGARETGWDWYALQLDDGSSLMFYALRDRGGGRDRYSAGTWVDAGGNVRPLRSSEVDIAATGSWRDADGVRYPAGWRLRVSALALEVVVRPVLADQELRTTPRYWEGAVDVSGSRGGRSVGGRGYVELVGYGPER
jgi:predicted secreted hydrolase